MSNETVNKTERENIYSLKGIGKVFKFTLMQTFKNKSYLLSFIIFVIVMIGQKPINYFSSKAGQAASDQANSAVYAETIDCIYIVNESDVPFSAKDVVKNLTEDELKPSDEEGETPIAEKLIDLDGLEVDRALSKTDCAIFISLDQDGYSVKGVISDDSTVSISEIDGLVERVYNNFSDARLAAAGVTEQDLQVLQKGVYIAGVESEADYKAAESSTYSSDRFSAYMFTFAILIFLMTSMSTSYVIASVTEEKTSKLVESLLVSVRPMALLLGKVLAMMSYVLLILVVGVLGSKIADIVMFDVMKLEPLSGQSQNMFNFGMLTEFGIGGFLIFFLAVMMGYLVFSVFAGMLGSACSSTEDIQSATGTVMMISMAGYFAAMIFGAMDKEILNQVFSYIPPLSFYVLPITYLTGRVGILTLIVSVAIQVAVLLTLVWIMARAYRNLLLTDSSKPKLSTVFKAVKN